MPQTIPKTPPRTVPRAARSSFLAKIAGAIVLIAIGDALFYGYGGGSVIAGFALAWLAVLVSLRPAIRRARGGWIAIACAAAMALALAIDPGLIAAVLFLTAIASAALLPRHRFDHAGRWFVRLAVLGAAGPLRAPLDCNRIARLPGFAGAGAVRGLAHIALPLVGGGVFLALFASANPVLGNVLGAVRLPGLGTLTLHALLWGFVLALVWPTLRPRTVRPGVPGTPFLPAMPNAPVASMLATLAIFNAVFAIQNVLDIVFLWSGAALPDGVTLAEYAHRGAYTLIATALLAGLFVLVALRPGSAAARHPLVRRLVLVWVAQNLLLVASSVLRLLDYIDVYLLTEWRISALVWMGLVAIGLLLICWRFLYERSAAWLINANALAAAAVLGVAGMVDTGAVAAAWNVAHLRDPARLDLCYMERQGASALMPLIALRDAPIGAVGRERAVYLSGTIHRRLGATQADWQSWTWRGARRLAQADRLLRGDGRQPGPAPHGRDCGGAILPPPPSFEPSGNDAPAPPPPAAEPLQVPLPLTPAQNP